MCGLWPGRDVTTQYLAENALFAGAKISFTHFSTLLSINMLTPALLEECFLAGLALICPPGQKGADLILPVQLQDGSVTAWFVQTKNETAAPQSSLCRAATADLLPENFLPAGHIFSDRKSHPCLTLYMQVGRSDGTPRHEALHLSITGFPTGKHVDGNIARELLDLRRAGIVLTHECWETSRGCAHLIPMYLPLTYALPASASRPAADLFVDTSIASAAATAGSGGLRKRNSASTVDDAYGNDTGMDLAAPAGKRQVLAMAGSAVDKSKS